MNTNEELRQQMWELAYGLLTPEETASLHARIKSDPAAARLYAEVRLQADLVADASKVNDPSFAVSTQGEPVVRPMPTKRSATSGTVASKSPSRGMNWLSGLAGTALAALLCIVLFRPSASSGPSAEGFVATAVEAPAQLQAGITQAVSVFTCTPDEAGTSADVDLRLVDAGGKERLRRTVRTDENGHAKVDLPGDAIEPGVRLEAIAKVDHSASESPAAADQPVSLAAEVIPEPVERYVLLDKPAYERGETVRFAVREVKRFSKQPVDVEPETLAWRDDAIRPDSGADISQIAQANESLVTGSLQLEGVPLADAETKSNFGQNFEHRSGGSEWFFFNQFGDDLPVLAKQQANTDKLALNDRFDQKSGDRDLARSRGLRMSAADAAPAAAGASADAAKPAATAPLAAALRGGQSSESSTGALMRKIAAKQKLDFEVIPSGHPIEVPLPSDRSADLLVTARCGDRLVAKEMVSWEKTDLQDHKLTKNVEIDGATKATEQATVKLTPVPEADGEILVSVFDSSQQPPQLVASHRYFREPQQRLGIELTNLRERYQSGQQVELQIQVLDEQSRPVDATLAVRVWNERLVQAAGAPVSDLASTVLSSSPSDRSDPNSLAMQSYRFGGGRAADGDEFGAKLADGSQLRGSKFADANVRAADLDALTDNDAFLGDVGLGDAGPQRLEASNLAAMRTAYETAVAEARQATAERKATIARLLMIGGLALLGLLGMQALLRVSPKASVWLPAVSIAAASLLVGMVWWAPSFDRGEVVQTAAVPEAKPVTKSATSPPAGGEAMESLDRAEENAGGFANDTRSLDKELRHPTAPQLPESASPNTEQPEVREMEERLKEKSENGALPYRKAEDDVALSNRSVRSPVAPAPPPEPAEAPADAPTFNAPAVVEEGMGRKGRGPSDEPQGLGRMELAESPATGDATRADAQRQPKSMERAKLDRAADKRLAGTEAASGLSPNSDEQQPDAPAAAGAASGAAPAAPRSDSVAAGSGGRGGGAPPPAPSARMARSQSNSGPTGTAGNQVADELRPSAAGLAGSKESVKDNDFDQQLAKKNASDLHRRMNRESSKREEKAQAASSAPAALLFEPALATNAKGQATIEFTLPDIDCEYRVLIDAIGHGRVGSLQQVIVGQAEASAR